MAAHPAAAWRCANGREPLDDPARRTGDARCRRGARLVIAGGAMPEDEMMDGGASSGGMEVR